MSNLVGLHGTKRDAKTAQAESSEFPILCETCLGPNPLVRMIRDKKGSACKICERPFTSFSWKPGPKARYKKTVLCQGCARQKHVCQTCVLDLTYGARGSPIYPSSRWAFADQRRGRATESGRAACA